MGRTGNSRKDNSVTIAVITTSGVIIAAIFGYLGVVGPYSASLHATQTAVALTALVPTPVNPVIESPTTTPAIKTSQTIKNSFYPSGGGSLVRMNCKDWISCHKASAADVKYGPNDMPVTYSSLYKGYYQISRIFLYFDTSKLPQNSTILNASLHLCSTEPMVPTPSASMGDSTIHIVQSQASDQFTANDFNAVTFTSGGKATYGSTPECIDISLNKADLNWIVPNGITELAILQDNDLNDILPSDQNKVYIIPIQTADPNQQIRLDITYSP